MHVNSFVNPTKQIPRVGRWRPRVSLRALLLLVTVFCIWLGMTVSAARKQERAVEVLESAGGKVGYDHDANQRDKSWWQPVSRGRNWLRALIGRHFVDTVVGVHFSGRDVGHSGKRCADVAARLSDLGSVRSISFHECELNSADFALLATHTNLEELHFSMMQISDHEAAVLSQSRNLRRLSLNEVIISAKGVGEFRKLTRLESFSLVCKHWEFGPGRKTVVWDIPKYKLGDEIVDTFAEMPQLRSLTLAFTLISDQGMKELSRLEQLEGLDISSPNITDASMPEIVKLKNLNRLAVGGTQIGDESLPQLQQLHHLKHLRLSAAVTNDGLPSIAQLQQLDSLDLGGKQIDDRGLVHLAAMKRLRNLDLQTTGVTTNGLAVRRLEQSLPTCQIRQYHPSNSFR